MPLVGYGLWKVPCDKACELVREVLGCGYRHLDSAANYGNEKEAVIEQVNLKDKITFWLSFKEIFFLVLIHIIKTKIIRMRDLYPPWLNNI